MKIYIIVEQTIQTRNHAGSEEMIGFHMFDNTATDYMPNVFETGACEKKNRSVFSDTIFITSF